MRTRVYFLLTYGVKEHVFYSTITQTIAAKPHDLQDCRGNIHVHVAAAPQIVLLYKFVCFACAGAHAKHTNLYYNLWSPQATRWYEDIAPTV